MFKFKKKYLFGAILLFFLEVIIAIFVHDSIIRPFGGDVLVVILLYFFARSFWNAPVMKVAIAVLLFAFFIEILQYFKIVKILGLQDNKIASIVIGTSFAWSDLLAYLLGFVAIILLEKVFAK